MNPKDRSGLVIAAGLSVCLVIVALAVTLPPQTPADLEARATHVVLAVRAARSCAVVIYPPTPPGKAVKDVRASGAGVIVDARGYILTSAHLTGSHKRLRLKLFDGTELWGDVVASELACDLAIVKVESPKPLTAIVQATAGDLEVGQSIVVIGSPHGDVQSAAAGIISHLDRDITMPTGDTIKGMIQIDATVNQGNSGGPLVNTPRGELVGIVCAMRDAHGLSYAVNGAMVKAFCAKHVPGAK